MTNPLLTPFSLPPFSAIRPEDIVPAVQSALADCRAAVERVVAQPGPFTGQSVSAAGGVGRSPVAHLVADRAPELGEKQPELRAAYEQALPLLSEYGTGLASTKGCTVPIAA